MPVTFTLPHINGYRFTNTKCPFRSLNNPKQKYIYIHIHLYTHTHRYIHTHTYIYIIFNLLIEF